MTTYKPIAKVTLAWTVLCVMVSSADVHADEIPEAVTYDPSFFPSGKVGGFDPAQFSRGNLIVPGIYRTDIELNGQWLGKEEIRFSLMSGETISTPCYSGSFFTLLNLNEKQLLAQQEPVELQQLLAEGYCGKLAQIIPGAVAHFDASDQQLTLSIPQLMLDKVPRGYVHPSRWEEGVTALMVNYSANIYQSKQRENTSTYGYLGLRNGLNIGLWRVRNSGAVNWVSEGESGGYKSTSTYLGRDITAIRSQIVLGDAFTSGELFDGVRFRGVRLYSDDRMLPETMRGYAPVIRGVANSNARVSVMQNGFVLYTTTVSPGPFEIADLYPTSYGGELTVRIEEAGGQIRTFAVPYSSMAQMLRPGIWRYEAAAGQVNTQGLREKPDFGSLTYQLGLTSILTGYSGLAASEGYFSALLGSAVNTPVGAISLDATQANTRLLQEGNRSGQSYRLGYSHTLPTTKTAFSMMAYRYSTSGFLNLNDAVQLRDLLQHNESISSYGRQRSALTLSVNQMLQEGWGNIFASGAYTSYWNQVSSQQSMQLGYSNYWHNISYSLSVNRTLNSRSSAGDGPGLYDTEGKRETQYALSISLPLGKSNQAPMLNLSGTTDSKGSNGQVGVAGTAGADNQLNYNLGVSRDTGSSSNFVNGSVGYRASQANLNASYSYGQGNSQASSGIDGSVVLHRGGLTLGQPMGETAGLVYAPGAEGVRITNATGVRIDRFGYAIVPYLQPYYANQVDLDPKGGTQDVQLNSTRSTVVPRAGALVKLEFDTKSSRVTYIKAKTPDGQPLPFAANVYDQQNNAVGVVGQASLLVVHDIATSGVLQVRWGEQETKRCDIHYQMPDDPSRRVIQGVCQ